MPEASSDPPIIITGGSVTVQFDDGQLQGGQGRYQHPSKKITRVEVTGGGININQTVNDPSDITIKVYYGD